MFPYKDENPTERPAVITVAIIIANVLAFILVQGAGAQGPLVRSVCEFGLIPGEVLQSVKPGSGIALAPGMACLVGTAPKYWTVLTSMFMHGDRKSTRLNSSHTVISYAVFCLKKKIKEPARTYGVL